MSNATIGSFTAGEWNAIKSDDKTYNALIKKYGTLKEAQRNGVDTKSTRSGLSLSNAHNTVKVMSGQRQYKTNLSKKTGYHLEGKKTQYNQSSTLSVKMGRGNRVQNTKAAGGARPINVKKREQITQGIQQRASKYATKTISRGTKSGSGSSKASNSSGSGSGRSTRGTTPRQKIKQTSRGSGGLLRNKKGTKSNKAHTRREKNKKRRYGK